ncbi:MAG TPA: xanthine dehydrogenase family protein subunit M [Acidimicrobiia bacterium]|nr:xanthine dehydrogenase family protein subunit M [Acidimicrobiia bacterium]
MKPTAFEYFAPRTVDEALSLLAAVEGAKVLAGGQSLVPAMNFRLARPAALIDVNRVGGLDQVVSTVNQVRIGAMTRHRSLENPDVPGPLAGLLSEMARHVGHMPIRVRGTIGGSLAHADPAAEWCLLARTLDATIVASSTDGEREISAEEFFATVFTTTLRTDEMLTEVRLPRLTERHLVGFSEFSRRAGDFALAMVLVAAEVEGGVVMSARVGAGGVSDVPVRLPAAESALTGNRWEPASWEAAAEAGIGDVDPFEDIHGSAEYRRDLVAALLRRACSGAGT